MAIAKFGIDRVLNKIHSPPAPDFIESEEFAVWRELAHSHLAVRPDDPPDCLVSASSMGVARPESGKDPSSYLPLCKPTMYGFDESNKPCTLFVPVPIGTFKDKITVDRSEIESIRAVRNLIRSYVSKVDSASPPPRPVSIAVFGAPGTGKSFTVKQLAYSINEARGSTKPTLRNFDFNVSQFRSISDLADAFQTVANHVQSKQGSELPLIFFDEFDCAFEGQPLAWLKSFLAPMQDGELYTPKGAVSIKNAIMVFAGGLYHEFDDFTPPPPPTPTSTGESTETPEALGRRRVFIAQKGPDFVSRLRGHIDIKSINARAGDRLPVIGRSILIRGILTKQKLIVSKDNLNSGDSAIDPDVLYALLTVDHYSHGARSIEAIVDMCSLIEGRIEVASLPMRSQMAMHCDPEEFYTRIYRSRVRRQVFQLRCEDFKKQSMSSQPTPSTA